MYLVEYFYKDDKLYRYRLFESLDKMNNWIFNMKAHNWDDYFKVIGKYKNIRFEGDEID